MGACCAKCHLSSDLLCESCRWVRAVLNVTYPATCCASLVGGCMLCCHLPGNLTNVFTLKHYHRYIGTKRSSFNSEYPYKEMQTEEE